MVTNFAHKCISSFSLLFRFVFGLLRSLAILVECMLMLFFFLLLVMLFVGQHFKRKRESLCVSVYVCMSFVEPLLCWMIATLSFCFRSLYDSTSNRGLSEIADVELLLVVIKSLSLSQNATAATEVIRLCNRITKLSTPTGIKHKK